MHKCPVTVQNESTIGSRSAVELSPSKTVSTALPFLHFINSEVCLCFKQELEFQLYGFCNSDEVYFFKLQLGTFAV